MPKKNSVERFALKLPQSFTIKQVIAATLSYDQGRNTMDYLLYIPANDIPEGGVWVDVIQLTNLPRVISGGAAREDDQVDAVDLLGYFDQAAQFHETCYGWTAEAVGDGNYYVTDAEVPDGAQQPERVEGIVLRIARSERVSEEHRAAIEHTKPQQPALQKEQTMETYVGVTLAECKAMTRGEYNQLRGWTLPENENPDDTGMLLDILSGKSNNIEGYKGYVTWLPTAEFDKTYSQATGLDFGRAVHLLRQGVPMCREGWNGKGMFVYYVPPGEYPARTGVAKQYYGDKLVPYNEYLAIKNVDGSVSTWVPSINDVFAEDWMTSH